MKNFLIQTLITLLMGGITQLFLPWWSLAVVCALVAFLFKYKYAYTSYFAGFLSLFLLWSIYALWIYAGDQGSILPDKIGALFGGLSGGSLAATAGLIGGLLGGFGALTGTLGRRLLD